MIDLNEFQTVAETLEAKSTMPDSSKSESFETSEHILPEPDNLHAAQPDSVRAEEELQYLKTRCLDLLKERELAIALTSESLLPGVASQLLSLWKDNVVAQPDEKQGFNVRSSDGRPLSEAIKDWLQRPEYRHFRPANTRGGTAQRTETAATHRVVNVTSSPPSKTLNEIVINQWRQRSQVPSTSAGWPRY